MRFIDEARIHVLSGKGGDGCASFRRERFVPFGGPDGADGGKGGDVILEATSQKNTLQHLRGKSIWKAKGGQPGRTRNCTGACADPIIVPVPVGTRVFCEESGEQLIDLVDDGERWVAAQGGARGLGNLRFKSSVNRAPTRFTKGKPGEDRRLRLELLLMADVGLLGFPNAGKSTLISCLSSARPKVADYPFTTLAPSLGVVDMGVDGAFTVADIPGLIRGAAQGAGLGHQFLRHVRRTKVLLHLLSLGPEETEDPIERYHAIRNELTEFDADLPTKTEIILLSKTDVIAPEDRDDTISKLKKDLPSDRLILAVSAISGDGLNALKHSLWSALNSLEDGGEKPA